VTRALLEHELFRGMLCESHITVLEPAFGNGAILAPLACAISTEYTAYDIRTAEECGAPPKAAFFGTDYLSATAPARRYDLAITNPPFSLAGAFARKMRREARVVALLTRHSWGLREEWMRDDMPLKFSLPDRISFVQHAKCERCGDERWLPPGEKVSRRCAQQLAGRFGICDGKVLVTSSDASEYCWNVWYGEPQTIGHEVILPRVPLEKRR
jgi:hypothetical protein